MKRSPFTSKLVAVITTLTVAFLVPMSCVSSLAGAPKLVTISLGFTQFLSETSLTGPFTIEGDVLNITGTYVQEFRAEADTLHCENVLVTSHGTIHLQMQCKMVWDENGVLHGPGHWVINGGTGDYANLHGAGKLEMLFDGVSTTIEYLEGFVFFDKRK